MVTNKDLPIHSFFFYMLLACACVLIAAYSLQWLFALTPCLLCLLERSCAWGILLTAAVGYSVQPKKGPFLGFLLFMLWLFVLGALLLSARHVWLQHLPLENLPPCLPSLDYLLETLPVLEVLQQILLNNTECATVEGRWWGISLAEGALIFFGMMTILLGYGTFHYFKKRG